MKIICIGRNYYDHAMEMKSSIPVEPVFFMKPDTSLQIKNRPFFYPDFSNNIHHEIEIVLKLCKTGRKIEKRFAAGYIGHVGLGVDFTARDLQDELKQKGLPWEKSKAFDFAAPVSEFIPVSSLPDLKNICFRLHKNGALVQNGNTSDMVFSFDEIISFVSKFITLRAGDLIFTGTPEGVGPVSIGDRLEGFLNDKKILDFYIR